MKQENRDGLSASVIASVLLHLLILGGTIWLGLNRRAPVESAPVAVELWSSAPPPPPADMTKEVSRPRPEPVEETRPAEETPKADVNLHHDTTKPQRKVEASRPVDKAKPKPEPVPQPRPEPKPQPKPQAEPKPQVKPVAAPHPAGKGSKTAPRYNSVADELFSDIGSTNVTRPANARKDQAGAKDGVAGGAANGSGNKDGYANRVQSKVKPLVQVPPDLNGNPQAVVQVTLLPSLEVREVKLLSSSGSKAYDDAVVRAIWDARVFPALPPGMQFTDVRRLTLRFSPK